ncbi:hypothetical protein KFL_000260170 [Klebsormidium nitens]|uniref:Uncharacterized protein n=1 Tax=Klebsormidium nitens TaxID=105231 RepID=A0A1Y1HQE1_KLENI|nr:hypothetical protein KFL_000260170 [Klebsormidium nitens]|eukprot:GAQ79201.1 hypothetical protein KFL_000260170 [Klebsormidium nitens]
MLDRRRSKIVSTLSAVRGRRKKEIEAALRNVGIHPAAEWACEKWPDTSAVDKYASDEDFMIDEVISCQRKQLAEAAARRAADPVGAERERLRAQKEARDFARILQRGERKQRCKEFQKSMRCPGSSSGGQCSSTGSYTCAFVACAKCCPTYPGDCPRHKAVLA